MLVWPQCLALQSQNSTWFYLMWSTQYWLSYWSSAAARTGWGAGRCDQIGNFIHILHIRPMYKNYRSGGGVYQSMNTPWQPAYFKCKRFAKLCIVAIAIDLTPDIKWLEVNSIFHQQLWCTNFNLRFFRLKTAGTKISCHKSSIDTKICSVINFSFSHNTCRVDVFN